MKALLIGLALAFSVGLGCESDCEKAARLRCERQPDNDRCFENVLFACAKGNN